MTETSTPTGAPGAAVRALTARFAALTGARRVLDAGLPAESVADVTQLAREAMAGLRVLTVDGAAGKSDFDRTLAQVGSVLERTRDELLSVVEQTPFSQIRALISEALTRHRPEVIQLAEQVLAAVTRSERLVRVGEYLLTQLATARIDGPREVLHDPADLSPLIASECRARARALETDVGLDATLTRLEESRREVEDATDSKQLRAAIESSHGLKEQLGAAVFAPDLLRPIVTLNAAIWNKREALLEEERTTDWLVQADVIASAEIEFEIDLDADDDVDATSPTLTQAELGSIAAQLVEIEDSITRRLRGRPGNEAGDRLAAGLDKFPLEPQFQRAFLEREEPDLDRLVRAMVATALCREREPSDADLVELGIRSARLTGRWSEALAEEVAAVTRRLVGSGRYDEARQLSALKQRCIELGPRRGTGVSKQAFAVEGSGEEIHRAIIGEGELERRAVVRRRVKRVAGATVALSLVLATVIGLRIWLVKPRNIEIWNTGRLDQVSIFLQSGYRSQGGEGRVFMGTLQPSFKELPESAREAEIRRIGDALRPLGLTEVQLYGPDRKVWVQLSLD